MGAGVVVPSTVTGMRTSGQHRQDGRRETGLLRVGVLVVAVVAESVMVVPFTLGAGLLAPEEVVPIFWMGAVVAVASLVVLVSRGRCYSTILVPLVHSCVYVTAMSVGERLWGWGA